jgi:lipoyl(octanoyl) transferase
MISVLHLGAIDYGTALQLQQSLVELRKHNRISDVLLLVEHPPVITFGRNSSQKNLLASNDMLQNKGVQIFESNRGGDVTFHGPGQLVGYPIFDLRGFSPRIGAVEFVRRIEEALIRLCGDLGIASERICGLTGVWTQGSKPASCTTDELQPKAAETQGKTSVGEQRKIAAIGIHISRGVTSHGFALNVSTDLDYFKLIIPCGITDRPVTSIAQELAGKLPVPTMDQVAHAVSLNFGRVFAQQMLWLESINALLSTTVSSESEAQSDSNATSNKDVLPTESTTIGVPLKVPREVRDLRHEQTAPQSSSEDEIFLA